MKKNHRKIGFWFKKADKNKNNWKKSTIIF